MTKVRFEILLVVHGTIESRVTRFTSTHMKPILITASIQSYNLIIIHDNSHDGSKPAVNLISLWQKSKKQPGKASKNML